MSYTKKVPKSNNNFISKIELFVLLFLAIIAYENKEVMAEKNEKTINENFSLSTKEWQQLFTLITKKNGININNEQINELFVQIENISNIDEYEYPSVSIDDKYFLILENNVLTLNIEDSENQSLFVIPTFKKNIFLVKHNYNDNEDLDFFSFDKSKNKLNEVPKNTMMQEYSLSEFLKPGIPNKIKNEFKLYSSILPELITINVQLIEINNNFTNKEVNYSNYENYCEYKYKNYYWNGSKYEELKNLMENKSLKAFVNYLNNNFSVEKNNAIEFVNGKIISMFKNGKKSLFVLFLVENNIVTFKTTSTYELETNDFGYYQWAFLDGKGKNDKCIEIDYKSLMLDINDIVIYDINANTGEINYIKEKLFKTNVEDFYDISKLSKKQIVYIKKIFSPSYNLTSINNEIYIEVTFDYIYNNHDLTALNKNIEDSRLGIIAVYKWNGDKFVLHSREWPKAG